LPDGSDPGAAKRESAVPASVAGILLQARASVYRVRNPCRRTTVNEVSMKRPSRPLTVLVVLFALMGMLPVVPASAAPSFSVGATSASPNPVTPGATTTITTSVTNTGTTAASGIIIDMEIYDAAGNKVNQGTQSGQQYTPGQSFAPGETKAYQWFWTVPANQGFGTYTIKIGVFADHWSQLYTWNNNAGTVTIQQGGAVVAFSVGTIAASPTAFAPGQATTITAQVTNTGTATASGINVLLELRDPLGNAFAGNQQGMGGQTFAPGEMKTYSFRWTSATSSAQGTYSASIGVFNLNWSTLYAWKTNSQVFTVGTAAQPTFSIGATTASPASVRQGQSVSITTNVTNTSTNPAANITIDVEIKNSAGTKILQQYVQGQTFSAGQARQFVYVFTIPSTMAAGTYYVDVAVFNGTWTTLYTYGYHKASFTVTP
jgi:hypothetical protein